MAFVGGSWSDSGKEDEERNKEETYLMAQASNELCLGINLEPNEWIKDSGFTTAYSSQFVEILLNETVRGFQQFATTKINKLKSRECTGNRRRGGSTQYGRPVPMHVFDKALNWHKQFIKRFGENVTWEMNETEVKKSLFIGGLKDDIRLAVGMFRPTNLPDVFCLAKMQEAIIVVTKGRTAPLLATPKASVVGVNVNKNGGTSFISNQIMHATTANPMPNRPFKKLTQQELKEKKGETLPNSFLDCVLSQDLTAFCPRLFTAFCPRFFIAFCLRLFTAFCLRLFTAFCLRLFTTFCLRLFTAFCLRVFTAFCLRLFIAFCLFLKERQQRQFLKVKSNEAKVKHDIDVIQTINIELEYKVAKLLKENATLKKHYKELFDSIKITRAKTIEHTTSLIATNDNFKAQLQEKGFAIAALKNELRKSTGNIMNNKFVKLSILGKPMLQSHRNQSVVSQPTAFKSERPRISKPQFASQVDVNNDLSKPVTTHYLPKEKEAASAKPHHIIASSNSRISSKNMPQFSSNDMVHNHYLKEAKKKTQERCRIHNLV
nr:hypothetical protein [Tanacetum cinerariifolium]